MKVGTKVVSMVLSGQTNVFYAYLRRAMNRETRRLKIIEENQMTPATDAAIRELLCICFPLDINVFSQTRYWHGSAPAYSLIQEQNGQVLGHVGIVVRLVRCGNAPALVAGIQNLAVRPELRGFGTGRQLVVESMNEALYYVKIDPPHAAILSA
jgi:hypothetical protein